MSLIDVSDLQAGDVGLGPIGGLAGWIPKIGQLLTDGRSWPEHAFIVTSRLPLRIVQAMPGGAEAVAFDPARHFTIDHVFYRPPYASGQPFEIGLEYRTGSWNAALAARKLVGTPYSFLDYLSIALWHWKIRPEWVARYIRSTHHLICSQLVDLALQEGGVHLFNDGRLPQDVTPSAMAKQMNALGWEAMFPRWRYAQTS